MKISSLYHTFGAILFSNIFCLSISSVSAQIIPDGTLPNNSLVTHQGNNSLIEGGTKAGGNLFHSFEKFSVPTGSTAHFNNSSDINNIISRVTGSSISNIDGLISSQGAANLFLINPSGIIFGPNASLNIGGSFLATTASSMKFADGVNFSATAHPTTPLLTVSIPIGLQFGGNPGSINVQGTGHTQFIYGNQVAASITLLGPGESQNGLRLQPGKTLALIGGDISFDGGVATAPSGRIEIGSVDSGTVELAPILSGWKLSYGGVNNFKDIRLTRQSLLDASGVLFGDIQVQGKNINFTDGSLALIVNFGSLNSGAIRVEASDTLDLTGITSFNVQPFLGATKINRGIVTSTESAGKGADIIISAKKLIGRDSVIITPLTFGTGNGGNLTINSTESVEILGPAVNESSDVSSTFGTGTYGPSQAGNVNLSTKKLLIQDGGSLYSVTFGNGNGGNLTVNASEVLKISGGHTDSVLLAYGTEPIPIFSASSIASLSVSAGNSGEINLKTGQLIIENGGGVAASGFKTGNSGEITIDASESVDVNGLGSVNPSLNPSAISSSVRAGDPFISYLYNLKQPPDALSGNLSINTRSLSLKNGAQVAVLNDSTKNAGTLRVNADSIRLDNRTGISASTKSGEGGDISLHSKDFQLRRGSAITANAGGSGNGGNITIDTGTLAALENSNITANAFEGRGGNIQIKTKGLFLSPDRQITASSQKGVNGTVQINAPEVDFTRAAVYFPSALNTPNIALICAGRSGGAATGELVNAGRGGIPISPEDPLNSSAGWYDNSIPAQETEESEAIAQSTKIKPVQKFVEAQGWKSNGDGTVNFTVEPDEVVPYGSLSEPPCHARALSTKN